MDKTAHIFNEMKGTFNITKGHPEIYVGLHIMRDRLTKTIHIDQDRYIEKILVKFGFQDATPMTILANPHSSLNLLFLLKANKMIPISHMAIAQAISSLLVKGLE
jgi:hypothetical protein